MLSSNRLDLRPLGRRARLCCLAGLVLAAPLAAADFPPRRIFDMSADVSAPLTAADLEADRAAVLERLSLTAGTFVDLTLPEAFETAIEVSVPLGGRSVVLDIEPYSLRAPDFRVLVQVDDGPLMDYPPPAPATFRGFVQGEPGSVVAVSIRDGQMTGTIDVPSLDTTYTIQPVQPQVGEAGPQVHVSYASDEASVPSGACGVTDEFLATLGDVDDGGLGGDQPEGGGGVLDVAQIAFDADFEFYQDNGSSVTATIADIENIMNSVDAQYDRDVDIMYTITTIIVRSTSNDPYTSSVASVLLGEFVGEWNANQQGIVRDVAHLMTGKALQAPVLGIANGIGTICSIPSSYSLAWSTFSGSFAARMEVTTHELGHNWDAEHCNLGGAPFCSGCCDPPAFTMCNGIQPSIRNQFCSSNIAQIVAFRDTRTCLSSAIATQSLPFSDLFNSVTVNNAKWMPLSGVTIDGNGIGEPSGTLSLRLNSSGALTGGDHLRSRVINANSACDMVLSFWFQRTANGNSPETGDDLFVDYLSSSLSWINASQQPGSGPDMSTYQQVTVALSADARHDKFRVRVRNVAGSTADEDDWYVDDITVMDSGNGITITQQPQTQSACLNATINLTVQQTGLGPFTYQWKKNNVNVPGATNQTLTIFPVTFLSGGDYKVVITNACAVATSNEATLTVITDSFAPVITQQPVSQTVCAGEPATFSVVASGDEPLEYQWRKDGIPIDGANATSYTIAATQPSDAGGYSVIVVNNCGPKISDTATLTVNTCSALVNIAAANPPTDNPFVAGTQVFRDVLQTGNTAALTQGIGAASTPAQDSVTYAPMSVTFSGTPSPSPTVGNVTIACSGGACPSVSSVSGSGAGPYQISLSAPVPPGHCTTLTFAGTNPGQKLQYQYLPADVNFSGSVSASDVSVLVTAISNGQAGLPANLPRYNINRSGGVSNADLLRLVGLLNGVSTTQIWTGVAVAACP